MAPHSGEGGAEPRPRKLKPEALTIARPMRPDVYTKMGLAMFGRSWYWMIWRGDAPATLAASTYSCTTTWRVADSATRETGGINTIVMATMVLVIPGPSAAAIPIASSSAGNAYDTSITRISTLSTRPPKYAATAPITVPIAVPIITGAIPASSDN